MNKDFNLSSAPRDMVTPKYYVLFRSSWDSGENRIEAQRVSRNQAFRYGIRAGVPSVTKIEFPYTVNTFCRRIFCFSGFLANIYRKYLGDDQIFWRLFCKRKEARKQRLEAVELKNRTCKRLKFRSPRGMFHLSSTTAAPYGSRGLFLIREMANFCYRFFFLFVKKKKTGKTTTTNKSAHAKAPKLSRCADVIQLCHRTSTMCQSPNSGQQFLPTELVFTLSRSLSAIRSQNDPGLEITLARISSSSL